MPGGGPIWRFHHRFNRQFESAYGPPTRGYLAGRWNTALVTLLACLGSPSARSRWAPRLGEDFFPAVDAGQFRLHVRAPSGTRIEETERVFGQVEDVIREIVPDNERDLILDNMGMTPSFTTRAYVDNGTVSDADGEILVSLKAEHRPTAAYVARLREELPRRFPGCTFYFQPADITSQILDFGLPAPINVQVVGVNREGNLAVAKKLRQEMAKIPGIADVHIHQITDQPTLQRGRGPRSGLGAGVDPAERDRQRTGVTERHHPGNPQLLGQPPEPRQLRAGRADTAGPHFDRGRPDEHADYQWCQSQPTDLGAEPI